LRLLTNPIVLRMALALFAGGFAFVMFRIVIRRMRHSFASEAATPSDSPSADSFPLHTYHAVIQQLKQQKHELLSMQQAERRRAKTSENISAAILSNLSSGVMFFAPNALVRQANAAAKQILGYASPLGMNAGEIFRSADLLGSSISATIAEVVQDSFHEKDISRCFTARYVTPSEQERVLDITLTSVHAPSGDVIGMACLITDQTEMAQIRRQQELRGEMSAEMALELRNALTTISGYAQQLAANRDPRLARQLASDIATEAAHLDRTIGGFLAGPRVARTTAEVQP